MKLNKMLSLSFSILILTGVLSTGYGVETPDSERTRESPADQAPKIKENRRSFKLLGGALPGGGVVRSGDFAVDSLSYTRPDDFFPRERRRDYRDDYQLALSQERNIQNNPLIDFDAIKKGAIEWREFRREGGDVLFSSNRPERIEKFLEKLSPEKRKNFKLEVITGGEVSDEAQGFLRSYGYGDEMRYLVQVPKDKVEQFLVDSEVHPEMYAGWIFQISVKSSQILGDQWTLGAKREQSTTKGYGQLRSDFLPTNVLESNGKIFASYPRMERVYGSDGKLIIEHREGTLTVNDSQWTMSFIGGFKDQYPEISITSWVKDTPEIRQTLKEKNIRYEIEFDGNLRTKLPMAEAANLLISGDSSGIGQEIQRIEMPDDAITRRDFSDWITSGNESFPQILANPAHPGNFENSFTIGKKFSDGEIRQ